MLTISKNLALDERWVGLQRDWSRTIRQRAVSMIATAASLEMTTPAVASEGVAR